MRSLSIATNKNRINIGLSIGASSEDAAKRLAELGVDLEGVEFREEPEAVSFSDLTDRLRPVMGGYKIDRTSEPDECTMGANVDWDGDRTFLTAAHCASSWVYQATYGSGNKIGEILLTPSTFTCTPEGQSQVDNCRYGDFALVEYDDSVSWSFGHIAKTFTSGQWSGSTAIKGRFWITDSY